MLFHSASGLEGLLRDCLEVHGNSIRMIDAHRLREERIDALVYNAMFQPSERVRYFLAWLIRQAAAGNAIYPASLGEIYAQAGHGRIEKFVLPVLSLQAMTYVGGRAAFQAARETGSGLLVFSLDGAAKPAQSPLDYTTCLLAAAIREGYEGPLFFEADCLAAQPAADEAAHRDALDRLKEVAAEALDYGYFNLLLDPRRLERLDLPDPSAQVQLSYTDCAEVASFVRQTEPQGVGSAIGVRFSLDTGSIARLRAFAQGFETEFVSRAGHVPGISKFNLNIRGEEDLDMAVDFAEVALREYYLPTGIGLEDAALPDDWIEAAVDLPFWEVRLGGRLEEQILHHPVFPVQLRQEMQRWIEDRAETLQVAYEQFKRELWDLPAQTQETIMADLKSDLVEIIRRLRVEDSIHLVIDAVTIQQTELPRPVEGYFQDAETTYQDILDQLG